MGPIEYVTFLGHTVGLKHSCKSASSSYLDKYDISLNDIAENKVTKRFYHSSPKEVGKPLKI